MAKIRSDTLIQILRTQPRIHAAALRTQLGEISRATLSRTVKALGAHIISGGGSKRTRYALRRALRGDTLDMPIYRIDTSGQGQLIAQLSPTYPTGCHLSFIADYLWAFDANMRDGWFEGLPYPIYDMRPQGFLGRHFAKTHATQLQLADNPDAWADDDILYALMQMGYDQPGDLIIGDTAYQLFLTTRNLAKTTPINDDEIALSYPDLAQLAMMQGIAGSSAGGEFPKFSALRIINQRAQHVIVKFSAAGTSPAIQRWSDLLVCEHIATRTLNDTLKIPATQTNIHQHANRTFLEISRFDRHHEYGRSPVCTLASINPALIGKTTDWRHSARALQVLGWLAEHDVNQINRAWWFGKLIANTDMHDGNLAFRPGLQLAPIYDMLPMMYAPANSGEVPTPIYQIALPLPTELATWQQAATAAIGYWHDCARDTRISANFRAICRTNCDSLTNSLANIKPTAAPTRI
ncbi:MAG: type II toxin-antitoxin system HipA family toxin YjjJ [Sulfuriferula sp.]|nr:type II toxin-antitoxin system HipA family toxin YjjJ [Sulfuriferula sp.]